LRAETRRQRPAVPHAAGEVNTMEPVKTPSGPGSPITEADLHAYVDQQLTPIRHAEVEQYLAARPDESQRVQDWRRQNEVLRAWLNPVLDEPLPLRLPLHPAATAWPWRALAAGHRDRDHQRKWRVVRARCIRGAHAGRRRRSHAHRRRADRLCTPRRGRAPRLHSRMGDGPVEVGADQEQQLVTWLSRRIGTPVQGAGARRHRLWIDRWPSAAGGQRPGRPVHVPRQRRPQADLVRDPRGAEGRRAGADRVPSSATSGRSMSSTGSTATSAMRSRATQSDPS
jgi:hypothetical protein